MTLDQQNTQGEQYLRDIVAMEGAYLDSDVQTFQPEYLDRGNGGE